MAGYRDYTCSPAQADEVRGSTLDGGSYDTFMKATLDVAGTVTLFSEDQNRKTYR